MDINLYKHQQKFADTAPDKYGVWHACGTGKTITGLYTVDKKATACLIVCPKGGKSKWQKEIKSFPKTNWLVVTKEEFRRDSKNIKSFDAIIIDEAHHFSSIKSQLHKAMIKFIKDNKIKYIYAMTATPYRREPMNIYALAKILGHKWDFMKFRYMFYYPQYFGQRVVWLLKKSIEKDVAKIVKGIGDVVAFSECADLPPVQHRNEFFDVTEDQKRALKELEMVEANPLVYHLREHQIMSGIGAKSAKLERILDLAEEAPKLAVFCRYTEQIEELKEKLKSAGHTIYLITGKTKDKNSCADLVNEAKKCVVIIQMDSAEGFELPSVDVVCFASMSYSYLAYEQSLGRFIRINKKNRSKLFIYLLTKKTIDEAVYKNIMAKQDFSLKIYGKERSKISK